MGETAPKTDREFMAEAGLKLRSRRREPCRHCGAPIPPSAGSVVGKLILAGLAEREALACLPICASCVESKYVAPSRGKYHADANLNAVCLWCESRREDQTKIRVVDEGPTWMVYYDTGPEETHQRLPKAARTTIPHAVIFERLDEMSGRKSS